MCKLTLFQRSCHFSMPYLNVERAIWMRFTSILFCFVRVYFVFSSIIGIESISWRIPGSFIDARYHLWSTLNIFLKRRRYKYRITSKGLNLSTNIAKLAILEVCYSSCECAKIDQTAILINTEKKVIIFKKTKMLWSWTCVYFKYLE